MFISMFKYINSVHIEPKSNSISKIKNPIKKILAKKAVSFIFNMIKINI